MSETSRNMNTNEICQQLKEQAPEVRNIPQLMNSLMFLLTEMDKTLMRINESLSDKKIIVELKIEEK